MPQGDFTLKAPRQTALRGTFSSITVSFVEAKARVSISLPLTQEESQAKDRRAPHPRKQVSVFLKPQNHTNQCANIGDTIKS